MDRKKSVIANVKYQSSKGKGAGKLKGILRYIQYRNDRDGHIPQEHGLERWVDRGLGGNFQTIASNCEAFKSEHVQAFTLVINPNPDLIDFIPEDNREDFVRELTESTIENFFEERGIDTLEWSYALHRRETTEDGRDNPHTHIILPGTYESWSDGGRLPLYFNNRKNENHIQMLHEVAQREIGLLLDRYAGLDWEQRYDTLLAERHQPFESLRQDHTTLEATSLSEPDGDSHGTIILSDGTAMQVWIGVQDDLFNDLQHVGFICRWEDEALGDQQAFIPQIENVSSQYAEQLSNYMLKILHASSENDIHTVIAFADKLTLIDPDSMEDPHVPPAFDLDR